MKIKMKLIFLFLSFFTFLQAVPIFDNSEEITISDLLELKNSSDDLITFLKDSSDQNLYYIAPKRVEIVMNDSTQTPLFRISYTKEEGAEFVGIMKLSYSEEAAEKAFSEIKTKNPKAKIVPLPFLEGLLALDLHSYGQSQTIAEAPVVKSSFAHGKIPFSIKITPMGMKFIKMQMQSASQSTGLVLRFSYRTLLQMPPLEYTFTFSPRLLFSTYLDEMQERWSEGETLAPDFYWSYWKGSYSRLWDVSGGDEKTNPAELAPVFVSLLEDYVSKNMDTPLDLRKKGDLETIMKSPLTEEAVFLDKGVLGPIVRLPGSANVLLAGFCKRYPFLVYHEQDGHLGCFDFPLESDLPYSNEDDKPYNPFENNQNLLGVF